MNYEEKVVEIVREINELANDLPPDKKEILSQKVRELVSASMKLAIDMAKNIF
jgi:hypothetical protein